MRTTLWLIVALAAGCDCSAKPVGSGRDSGPRRDTGPGGGFDAGPRPDAGPGVDTGSGCEPPDMLIVLDHTMSMHRTPEGMTPADDPAGWDSSKWGIAVAAIEGVTAELDTTIRFGLERFPRDPGGDSCVTLSERIRGMTATNPSCEEGAVVVPPALDSGDAIAAALDRDSTLLCRSTPIGAAVMTATAELARLRDPIREQFVILITDGQDTCDDALLLMNVQSLAATGVEVFVVAFDATMGGIDVPTLNNLACAGRTAAGFPAPCTMDAMGNYTATMPDGPPLFLVAEDSTSLVDSLRTVSGDICCGCII